MNNPFIDTKLYTTVELRPDQLNNSLYSNMKQNLIKSLEKKCFRKYGYINKIYEIIEHDQGRMYAEDNNGTVTYRVTFSCNLCHPLEKTQIICKVNQISQVFVNLIRDPIHIFVTIDNINKNVFTQDPQTHKLKLKNGDTLEVGRYVKATITAKKFTDKDVRIMAMATLDDVATDEEVDKYFGDIYVTERKLTASDEKKSPKPKQETRASEEEALSSSTSEDESESEKGIVIE